MTNESNKKISLPVMRVTQPIGQFYVGKMPAQDLIDISFFDIRRLANNNEFDEYLGIQRKISDNRITEIAKYVKLEDASFPTAVILAVQGRCTTLEPVCGEVKAADFLTMTLENIPGELDDQETVLFRGIARVLDGQHRIMGLKEANHDLSDFDVSVCIFVDADLADQSSIFATVNLAQTKVNKSLVYDLLSYSKSRSPERTCHTVTVALDKKENSPFYKKIKRLGVSTEGRFGEILTQATVVQSLLPYLSKDPIADRDIGKRIGKWLSNEQYDNEKLIFRHWFINNQDEKIAEQLMHYFESVRRRWPKAWDDTGSGMMLARTNGFRGFMRFLRPAYNHLSVQNEFVKMSQFSMLLDQVKLKDKDFNTTKFLPGGAGEMKLFNTLMEQTDLDGYN